MGIALEFCVNGSLKQMLNKLQSEQYANSDQPFVENSHCISSFEGIIPRLVKWSKEIATGMEHLERLKVQFLL